MGNICFGGLSKEDKMNKRIEMMNKTSFQQENDKIKLLLLGAGESGKSTLFKQMRILYGKTGFKPEERIEMRQNVYKNIVFNLAQLLNENPVNLRIGKELLTVWNSEKVRRAWAMNKSSGVQVQDSLEYFMEESNFNRVIAPEYLPTDQDILRTRVRTSGILEEEFEMEGNKIIMVDVGGQRNERRKWIHAFEDVDCIIFVAAISEYDQVLYEDNSVQRQTESLELFKKIGNDNTFHTNALILFLNKTDLFKKKLLSVPFRDVSKNRNVSYTGVTVESVRGGMTAEQYANSSEFDEVYTQSSLYLQQLYQKQIPENKQLFVQFTCATDTQQIKHIMTACREIFLKKNLQQFGFTR